MLKNTELTHLVTGTTLVFFVSLLLGIVLAIVFPFIRYVDVDRTQALVILQLFGFGLLVWGTVLVFLSQRFRKALYLPNSDHMCFDFYVGPYKYFRHPTYMGLVILCFGLSAIMNAIPVAVVTIITIIVVHFSLIKEEEKALQEGACAELYRAYLESKH